MRGTARPLRFIDSNCVEFFHSCDPTRRPNAGSVETLAVESEPISVSQQLVAMLSQCSLRAVSLAPLAATLLLLGCGGASASKAPANSGKSPPSSAESRLAMDPAKIVYSMRGNEDGYRKCFMRSPHSQGAVGFHFDINAEGTVERTSVAWSSFPDNSAQECLNEKLRQQRFGEHSQARTGTWTFVFGLSKPLEDDEREELLEKLDKESRPAFQLAPGSQGQMDAQAFSEMVQVRYPLYAHCYRDSIGRRGESRGILRLKLSIDEHGRLLDAKDAGSVLPDPYAVDCMASAFYAIDFPVPRGGKVAVEYRLDFE